MRKVLVFVGGVAVLIVVAIGFLGRPADPVPQPEGVTPLVLRTWPPRWQWPGPLRACPLASFVGTRVVTAGRAMEFRLVDTGESAALVFPPGFQAWLVGDTAELITPEGLVLAREGDVLVNLAGSAADNGDFNVCFSSPDEYSRVMVRG